MELTSCLRHDQSRARASLLCSGNQRCRTGVVLSYKSTHRFTATPIRWYILYQIKVTDSEKASMTVAVQADFADFVGVARFPVPSHNISQLWREYHHSRSRLIMDNFSYCAGYPSTARVQRPREPSPSEERCDGSSSSKRSRTSFQCERITSDSLVAHMTNAAGKERFPW